MAAKNPERWKLSHWWEPSLSDRLHVSKEKYPENFAFQLFMMLQ